MQTCRTLSGGDAPLGSAAAAVPSSTSPFSRQLCSACWLPALSATWISTGLRFSPLQFVSSVFQVQLNTGNTDLGYSS